MSLTNSPPTLLYYFALVKMLSISVEELLVIRDGRSINGNKPSEYMVSKKYLAAWSELCFRISKLKSPHIKIVLETDIESNIECRMTSNCCISLSFSVPLEVRVGRKVWAKITMIIGWLGKT